MTTAPARAAAEHWDAIVVGAGHNGLVAAFYLARAGLRTLVLERRGAAGGPAGTVEVLPGHRTSITNSPGSLEASIVADMDLARHGLTFIRTEPTLFTPFEDGSSFVGWRDQGRVADQLRGYAPGDDTGFLALLKYVDTFAAAIGASPFAPPPSLRELAARLTTPELEEAFGKIFLGSIRDLASEYLASEQARALIAVRGIVSVQASPSMPGTVVPMLVRALSLAAKQATSPDDPRLVPLRGTTGFPKGGMGTIIAAMLRAVAGAGGIVRTRAGIRRILVENGRAIGVEGLDGAMLRAPIVVSNAHPRTTLLELTPRGALPAAIEARLRAATGTGSAFKMVLSLDRPPRFRHARTEEEARLFASCQFRIAPSLDYMERAYDDCKYGRPSTRPLMWGLCPTMIDPDLAPPGRHMLSVNIWHAPYRLAEGDWRDERERFGARCIDVLEGFMPGLTDSICDRVFWSPVDLEREYGLLESNVIQGDPLARRMFSLRPVAGMSDYRTPIAGLYLCGTGTWPGGFVSGIPGHNAAHEVLKDVARGSAATQ
jgi:phytoene dehydrogenase-like protein